ncbi:sugar phosphate isomerase/epimerase [Neobacillus sp. MM2021_6]|uniref:sugar phosphate isomerase/epimerase family protein n=1 Tax=Bacillaceae TaxID=186817 RepID=UPI00140A091F|nr:MULTISPECIES: sugar phosphate isomerase/epimerase family protein [Bacillaceae]MBO0958832.1 sugar phosphate isomerase/epimerase [Neobacillus sp. MM2021_6]NHC21389.1 sugar phosphate isomerase/epimerase [Bacillus sp. MM2020_4]
MKVGLSTYSLVRELRAETMTILDVIQWIADNGGEHMEIVPYGFTVVDHEALADQIREKAASLGIELSAYSFPANFVQETEEAFTEEVERIKKHVDIVNRLGIKIMRHDVTAFTLRPEEMTIHYFEEHYEKMVKGSQLIADYAAQYRITTTIENHGFNVQASDRVQKVIHGVNRDNFKTTLDVGNFLCMDEDPLVGVKKNLQYAATVHLKDFYIRPYYENPGGGEWFRTVNENYLRGAIVGHGDLNIREILRLVKSSGYDGYLTVEFEGMEDCKVGSKIGMENVRRLWNEVQ